MQPQTHVSVKELQAEFRISMGIRTHPPEGTRDGEEGGGETRLRQARGHQAQVGVELAFGREGLEGQREVLGGY